MTPAKITVVEANKVLNEGSLTAEADAKAVQVDDEAPKTRGLKHLKVRAKRWALVAERDMKVTADNMHLLKSMVRIQSGGKGE